MNSSNEKQSQARGALLLLLCLAILGLAGCKGGGDQQKQYEALSASNFGLGIGFGQSREAVKGVLGAPDGFVERQAKRNVDEYYRPQFSRDAENAPGSKDTQLLLSYLDDKLVRVYARYNPTADQPDLPPFNPEPFPGLKLGVTRKLFDDVLGAATEEEPAPKWVFTSKDSGQVALVTEFIDPAPVAGQEPKTGPADVVCVSITVAQAGATSELRGEEFDKAAQRKKRLKENY